MVGEIALRFEKAPMVRRCHLYVGRGGGGGWVGGGGSGTILYVEI